MNKVFLFFVLLFLSIGSTYAYAIICPTDGGSGVRNGCLRVTDVNINGEWVEATCDNFEAPSGWFKYDCP